MAWSIAPRRVSVRLEPVTRAPVELGFAAGLTATQFRAKHVGEQLVVAIPAVASVERDEHDVGAREAGEHVAGAVATRARRRTAAPTGGVSTEVLVRNSSSFRGQLGEELLANVLGDEAVVAGELVQVRGMHVLRPQGQRREIEPGGPALGTLDEPEHLLRDSSTPAMLKNEDASDLVIAKCSARSSTDLPWARRRPTGKRAVVAAGQGELGARGQRLAEPR